MDMVNGGNPGVTERQELQHIGTLATLKVRSGILSVSGVGGTTGTGENDLSVTIKKGHEFGLALESQQADIPSG